MAREEKFEGQCAVEGVSIPLISTWSPWSWSSLSWSSLSWSSLSWSLKANWRKLWRTMRLKEFLKEFWSHAWEKTAAHFPLIHPRSWSSQSWSSQSWSSQSWSLREKESFKDNLLHDNVVAFKDNAVECSSRKLCCPFPSFTAYWENWANANASSVNISLNLRNRANRANTTSATTTFAPANLRNCLKTQTASK